MNRSPIDWAELSRLAAQWSSAGTRTIDFPEEGYQTYRRAFLERLPPDERKRFEARWPEGSQRKKLRAVAPLYLESITERPTQHICPGPGCLCLSEEILDECGCVPGAQGFCVVCLADLIEIDVNTGEPIAATSNAP